MDPDRAVLERRWLKNWHYYNGRHFLTWNNSLYQWDDSREWRRPFVANIIRPTTLRTVSKLVGSMPIPRVAPETDSSDDRAASRLGEKALLHLWDDRDFQSIAEQVTCSMCITGVAFYKVSWNPDIGPSIRFYLDEDGQIIEESLDEEQKEALEANDQYRDIPAGDVDIEAMSSFELLVDPDLTGKSSLDKARWVCEVGVIRKSVAISQYGEKALEGVSWDNLAGMNLLSEQLRSETAWGWTVTEASEGPADDDDPRAAIKIYWEKPTWEFPEGIMAVMIGESLVDVDKNIYADPNVNLTYPYFPARWGLDPEKFFNDGLVGQLVPIQEEYDLTRTQMIENKERMANPKWMVAKGSDIPESSLTGYEGEIVEFNPNFPAPVQSQPAPLPPYVDAHIQLLLNEFQVIAADRDPTQAKTPSSLRSGVAIQLLDEKDRNVLAATMTSVKQAIQRVARACLVLMGEFYLEPRLLKTAGDNYMYEVSKFLGANLRTNYDVRIYVESGAGESRAARQSAVLDYVQLGILNPQDPDDKRRIMKALEYGDPQDFISEILIDERLSEIENERLMAGIPVNTYPWYDHSVHARVHKREMKSEAFLRADPRVQDNFVQHLQVHDDALAKQAQAELAFQQSQRGGPGQKGAPSAPKR